jgi:cholera toxin transcriptional activator
MSDERAARRYRFGVFEADAGTGELRRKGVRVKLHAQPFQLLLLLLEQPGAMLTRDQICRELWPDNTFVDYEHGVNSAVNRLREALGDKASNPRFVETLARRGYRFVAPVERLDPVAAAVVAPAAQQPAEEARAGFLDSVLATPQDLPQSPHRLVRTLFVLLQLMYLGFYVGALANLAEINELFSPLSYATEVLLGMIMTAAALIPVRIFLLSAVAFRAPGLRHKFLRMWWALLPFDLLWALSPFLLLHHIPWGLALACTPPLVYSPFAQRALMLMGAGDREAALERG